MPDDGSPAGVRVAVLSSADRGGGGIAASRLADALNAHDGISADFLTGAALGGMIPEAVGTLESKTNHLLSNTHYTVEYPGYHRDWLIGYLGSYDVLNVHWASCLLSLAELDALSRRGKRMLFMLHDFYYITGGCHYPAGCTRMTRGCFNCPQVDETLCDINVIPVNLRIKQGIFARSNVHLAAPSQYLRDQAVASGIVPIARAHVLRNPYVPLKPVVRRVMGGVCRILLIADSLGERRKGMPLALDSLAALQRQTETSQSPVPFQVDVVGIVDEAQTQQMVQSDIPYKLHGRIVDHERLAEIFAASDIVLSCSYEDNWPNILIEAGAYGCMPVVGPRHGCEEFVRVYKTGGVATAYTAKAFADALVRVMKRMATLSESDSTIQTRIRTDHRPDRISEQFLDIVARIRADHS